MKHSIFSSLSRFPRILALGAALAASSPLHAETWISLDAGAAPGTPASLELEQGSSNEHETVLDLRIYGFWRRDVVGDDGQAYARLDFPGLGQLGEIGAPELPASRPQLAVPTDASVVTRVAEIQQPDGVVSFSLTVYPAPVPARDGDEQGGIPEQFVKDEAIYASSGAWPASEATDFASVGLRFGSVPHASIELLPARFDPATGELLVVPHMRVVYSHSGAVQPFAPMTLDRELQCSALFANWPSAGGWFVVNKEAYGGRYLIVTPEEYLDELEDFIAYRKATGFAVTVRTLEQVGFASCGNIRGAIDAWYSLGLPEYDHYCLLVGDADVIPMCPSPNVAQILGDDLYGSPAGTGDLDEEVYVGRVSVNDGADLVHQLGKIMAYETDMTPSNDYGRVLLAAHKESNPGEYSEAHEAVANASYDVQPTFDMTDGGSFGVDDSDVTQEIEQGVGLVAYRGHGGHYDWADWNYSNEWLANSWRRDDVEDLENDMLPVVWSFSCLNQNIDANEDCLGEVWMEDEHGSVAHYGSQEASGTYKNHVLDAAMFYGLFELGLTTHAHAIEFGETVMKDAYPFDTYQNEWMYFLLGDPAMKIRRMEPLPFELATQPTLPVVGATAEGTFSAQVLDPTSGTPAAGVLVSAYKPGPDGPGGSDEVFANAYTDANGLVVLPSPKTLGDMTLSIRDLEGNVQLETIPAQAGAFVDLGDALAGSSGEPRLTSEATLIQGSEFKLELTDGLPQGVGLLLVGDSDNPTPLVGGVVHPIPITTFVPVALDAVGAWELTIPSWPQMQAGTQFVLQAALLDAGATEGVALTNGLRAVTP